MKNVSCFPFPSGARLARLMPQAQRFLLPDSGHAPMLESDIDIAAIMAKAQFLLPKSSGSSSSQTAASIPTSNGVSVSSNGNGGGGGSDVASNGRVVVGSHERDLTYSNGTTAAMAHANGNGAVATADASIGAGSYVSNGTVMRGISSFEGGADAAADALLNASLAAAPSAPESLNQGSSGNGSVPEQPPQPQLQPPSPAAAKSKSSAESASSSPSFDRWSQLLLPWRQLISPKVFGAENLPDLSKYDRPRPIIFVGNHQKMGLYDLPLLLLELYYRQARFAP